MKANAAMLWLLALLSLLGLPAQAQTSREVRKQIEASMLVVGTVDIDRSGEVTAHALDNADKLPASVVGLVDKAITQVRFEPILVDGKPVLARAKMNLRIVARPMGEGTTQLSIASAQFGEIDKAAPDQPTSRDMPYPKYPFDVMRAGGQGVVYLMVQIGRDGKVMDAIAEQVNLTVVGSARDMERMRRSFADSALEAVRKWVFNPPTTGELVNAPYWSQRISVGYTLGGSRNERDTPYGSWHGYLPGPRQRVPWITDQEALGSPDAVAAGEAHTLNGRFRLLTPLGG